MFFPVVAQELRDFIPQLIPRKPSWENPIKYKLQWLTYLHLSFPEPVNKVAQESSLQKREKDKSAWLLKDIFSSLLQVHVSSPFRRATKLLNLHYLVLWASRAWVYVQQTSGLRQCPRRTPDELCQFDSANAVLVRLLHTSAQQCHSWMLP